MIKKKILFDCDNTMGLNGKDVDDGLTLLYLLGRSDIEIIGVTTTFGNSTIDDVYRNSIDMFNDIGINYIPLLKGAKDTSDRQSEASDFLVEMVNKYPNQITLLGTGSLTNLYGAYEKDNNFFEKLEQIVLMGGLTRPLVINNQILDELNFSCDPEATYNVLSSNCKTTVLTGHICLQAFFGKKEYDRLMNSNSIECYKYIKNKSYKWYEFFMNWFNIDGFFNWDIVASMYITNPELFDDNILNIVSSVKDLETGFLKVNNSSNEGYKVNIPTCIKDINLFNEIIFKSWENVKFSK
ncbi:inosine-uridine nucleoside N-ribohydrolase [Gottschalkia purinilytica]|uniref:Inosine-uridine nucleoside N-ribohydrolase n=1 Tax=Gottschalkia purinilytica TaxID=1503 RepID=A0A0L0W713_GOTPU|nr:nucleoside hydrolase [Gottschalkia purinilytica]KNF07262.1 inosine-uridine nucleoside N-ribohydrolase [Gottschalkia purinilytica]